MKVPDFLGVILTVDEVSPYEPLKLMFIDRNWKVNPEFSPGPINNNMWYQTTGGMIFGFLHIDATINIPYSGKSYLGSE